MGSKEELEGRERSGMARVAGTDCRERKGPYVALKLTQWAPCRTVKGRASVGFPGRDGGGPSTVGGEAEDSSSVRRKNPEVASSKRTSIQRPHPGRK